jgi:uncharacterized repeat protein (TIGR03803 family)
MSLSLHRVGIIGALAVLPALAQVNVATLPGANAEAPRHSHAPIRNLQVRPDASAVSENWSGYAVTGAPGSVTDAKGSWVVPAVNCSELQSPYLSSWVGIDGWAGSATAEEIGTESECLNGTASYYAWYAFYPGATVEIQSLTIKAGDRISADVAFSGGQFTVNITDETSGASSNGVLSPPPGYSAQRSSAEWISEDQSEYNDFGTVVYGNEYTNAANTCGATVGNQSGPIGSLPGWFPITQVNSSGAIEATPSPLSSDGSSFSVTWQGLTTLWSFDGTNGAGPDAALVQATDGNFYGTTSGGGANGDGTIFKINQTGTLTTLSGFCPPSGCPGTQPARPMAGLVQGTNGDLYGTTYSGGANGSGTVFKISPSGTLTTLWRFCSQPGCADGKYPGAALVQATNANFYGTTSAGGANNGGTIFKITPSGSLTTLYSFCCTAGPNGALIQSTNGDFYGTTYEGGANANHGTVFKITPSGKLTTLYSFCAPSNCTDGSNPVAGLVQGTDGNFYGTTYGGGASNYGTVFKITPGGKLTTLYSFCAQSNCTDGYEPVAGLVQATDGNFYGTTLAGGAYLQGTVFKITPSDKLTTPYSFCSQVAGGVCTDGGHPQAGLIQGTDGNLYGTTSEGGAYSIGTVFSLSVGLGSFVETQTTSGKVGAAVKILGTDLTGATSVSFNGTAAAFKVVSSSEITTTVPAGATTGTVRVVTPSGTLSSNVPFRVP